MNVILLGGGYTNVWAYRALTRWLGKRVNITLVSDTPNHIFHGFTGEVLAGDMPPHYVESKNLDWAPRATHIDGKATHVDTVRKTVTVTKFDGSTVELPYDQLVVGTGASEHTERVAGLTEHGWRLRTPGMPGRLVQKIEAAAAAGSDPQIVVVGAGFTGTEASVAIARRLHGRGKVTLVAGNGVVPIWVKRRLTSQKVHNHIRRAAVELISDARVLNVDTDGVQLSNGQHLPATFVVSALGYHPNVPAGLSEYVDADTGFLIVDRNLAVAPNIWAAGDVAAVRNAKGNLVAKDALWAIMAGTRVGRNIVRTHTGRKPKPFGFKGLGEAATFAPGKTVTVIFGITLPGVLAYVVRQTLFLWFMPSRKNALTVLRKA